MQQAYQITAHISVLMHTVILLFDILTGITTPFVSSETPMIGNGLSDCGSVISEPSSIGVNSLVTGLI